MTDPLASRIIKPLRNNFVERPWGGTRIRAFKGLCPLPGQREIGGAGIGEAFEIAAFDDDPEAALHPSMVRLENGSLESLPKLLESRGPELLGESFVARYGTCFPLLPKTLDILELLSVQGHPEGNTEAYVILDAEPGATIRLGFKHDVDPDELGPALVAGRENQRCLIEMLAVGVSESELQAVMADWMACASDASGASLPNLSKLLADSADTKAAAKTLLELRHTYWRMLDSLNVIHVEPGQVIHNANPERIVELRGTASTAEVHALGNPEGLEVLALEVRRPGATLRVWDNARFPLRDIDVFNSLRALNLHKTEPSEFLAERRPVPDREGASVSIDSEYFRVEHLCPREGRRVLVPAEHPHSLHAIEGAVQLENERGEIVGRLERGESAIVPIGVGAYAVRASRGEPEVVRVSLPL